MRNRIYTNIEFENDLQLFGLKLEELNRFENKKTEVNKIFRRLGLKYHPDKANSNLDESVKNLPHHLQGKPNIEIMQAINNARDNLTQYLDGTLRVVTVETPVAPKPKKEPTLREKIIEIVADANKALREEYEKLSQVIMEHAFMEHKGLTSADDIVLDELLAFENDEANKLSKIANELCEFYYDRLYRELKNNNKVLSDPIAMRKTNAVENTRQTVCKSLNIDLTAVKSEFDEKAKDILNKSTTTTESKKVKEQTTKDGYAEIQAVKEDKVGAPKKSFFARHKWKIIGGAFVAAIVVGGLLSFGILSAVGVLTGAGILATVGGGLAMVSTTVGGTVAVHVGVGAIAVGTKAAIGTSVLTASAAALGGSTGALRGKLADRDNKRKGKQASEYPTPEFKSRATEKDQFGSKIRKPILFSDTTRQPDDFVQESATDQKRNQAPSGQQ